jgi:hypothetical protein
LAAGGGETPCGESRSHDRATAELVSKAPGSFLVRDSREQGFHVLSVNKMKVDTTGAAKSKKASTIWFGKIK